MVLASLEANLADVVRLSDMVLELDEGLEVLAPETELGPLVGGPQPVADM